MEMARGIPLYLSTHPMLKAPCSMMAVPCATL